MTRILVVDDSPLMRRLVGSVLSSVGVYEIAYARNGVEALEQVRNFNPDIITLDIEMPDMDGLACLDRIMLEYPRPVVMVSSQTAASATATLRAMELGAVDFLPKPSGPMALEIDKLAPILLEKLEAAATVRLPRTRRLTERVRSRLARAPVWPQPEPVATPPHQPEIVPPLGDIPGAVIVGASTGGPPALDALVSGLPGDFPSPILIAQHMPASFTGPLARRLDSESALTVVEVTQPIALAAGHVYIGRGDADLIVGKRPAGLVALPVPTKAEYRWHPSVNRLVESAMSQIGAERLIGVLLTGMGNDGAPTMSRMRTLGGRTIAESEETAVIWGMPGELVKAGGAQFVLPIDKIASFLVTLVGSK